MKVDFIVAINGITITDNLSDAFIINPKLENSDVLEIKLTNDKAKVKSMLTPKFKETVGLLEYDALTSADLVAYSSHEIDDKKTSPMEFLSFQLGLLRLFSISLWLIKDNCLDFDLGFIAYSKENMEFISSNYLSGITFDSKGERNLTKYSKLELIKANNTFKSNIEVTNNSNPLSYFQSSSNRLTISVYYLQYLRQIKDLGLKISTYINVLESLFSTDNKELSHKLAERVAFIIGETPDRRIEIYSKIKKAYGIRSKIFHGSGINSKDIKEVHEISVFCDTLLRELFNKMFNDKQFMNIFGMKVSDLDKYFNELVIKR